MADNRKYYYLKLKENFFDSDSIVLLEDMKDGILYSNILLKLYLKSLKNGGQYWLKRFTGNITNSKTLNFAYATTIEANQPYIIALPGDTWGTEHSLSGKTITVEATDVTISASPQPKESGGGDYSFTGTYDGLKIGRAHV